MVPFSRRLLATVEHLSYAFLVSRLNEADRSLHVEATVVWQRSVQEGGIDVERMAHHGGVVRNGQHGPNGSEAVVFRKRAKVVEAMHLSEAARNPPRLVLV